MKHFAFAALIFTSTFAQAGQLDCASMTDSQAQTLEHDLSSDSLKDLAKTCDQQAATLQKIAQEARANLPQQDVSNLYAKAANAHLQVARFTNDALMK